MTTTKLTKEVRTIRIGLSYIVNTFICGTPDLRGDLACMSMLEVSCLYPSAKVGTWHTVSPLYILVSLWWCHHTSVGKGFNNNEARLKHAIIKVHRPVFHHMAQSWLAMG
ncbi:hypothetical protein PVK06_007638 [Gossypium arboreum]|uniref:Uncharacterized protein n=1 Tax=Gossypium arboreum TaxID=29729 RepID=A0ABR0QIS9_GOSAR|nr:hypothetical protein PVK06_007638 [Gossypium arboreum]